MRKRTRYSDKDIVNAVKKSQSWSELCRTLDLKVAGGTITNLKKKVKNLLIDTSHFKGKAWQKGLNRYSHKGVAIQAAKIELPWENMFCKTDKKKDSQSLLRRLVRGNRRKLECEMCGVHKWNGKAMVFELHHINKNNCDNRESNLIILCPNCHRQQHIAKKTISFYNACCIGATDNY